MGDEWSWKLCRKSKGRPGKNSQISHGSTTASLLVYARTLTREDTVAWDLVQDAFVVAWQNMGKFDVTGNFASWMRGIVRNKWREWLRARRRLVPLELDAMEDLEATMKAWDELRQDGGPTVFGKLDDCLAKLPGPLAAAVQSFYYDGDSSDEAAGELGIEGAALRKRLQRARHALKQCLEQG